MAKSNRSKWRINGHNGHQRLGTRGLLHFLGYKNCRDSGHPRESDKKPKSIDMYLMSTVAERDWPRFIIIFVIHFICKLLQVLRVGVFFLVLFLGVCFFWGGEFACFYLKCLLTSSLKDNFTGYWILYLSISTIIFSLVHWRILIHFLLGSTVAMEKLGVILVNMLL